MEFYSPTLNDKNWVTDAFLFGQTDCCEYCFGNIFMWSDIYENKICRDGNVFVSADFTENILFCYPIGKGNKKATIQKLIEYTQKEKLPLHFYGLTKKDKAELENFFGDKFSFIETRDYFDYVYTTESLANLKGRKLASKRNHISFFEKNFDWSFEPINSENIEQCKLLNEHWQKLNAIKNPEEINNEHLAIKNALDNYFDLNFEGGVLKIQDEVVAFSFGERLNDTTFCTHVEKAYSNIRGAYQMINRELARYLLDKYEFINREDDTGSEGLRQAKMSYYPHMLVEKYEAIYRE